ncbi:MAG: TauD/TfdA family dioxygenase [Alphaproteobacteria bacterium]
MTFADPSPDALWKGADFSSKDDVAIDLDRDAVAACLPDIRALAAAGREAVSVERHEAPMTALAGQLATVRDTVLNGRGLVILRGFPVDALSQTEIEIFYWAVGLHLGLPVSQSVMGDRLGHVIDVSGRDSNARAYRNSNELTPHTDPADVLAFLCLKPAKSGGVSYFASSHTVHEEIRKTRPDLLERLYRGYRWHRFGEQPDGFDPITPHRVPVFSERDGLLSCRVVRQYIEIAADEYPELGFDDLDREALDLFDALAVRKDIGFEFTLASGEAVIANNFTVLHSRTAFDDYDDPALKRHLLRLWIAANPTRPVVREVFVYGDGEPGIPPRAGSTPFYENRVALN